jgi:tetratricopeptide (TPR) repeat protein
MRAGLSAFAGIGALALIGSGAPTLREHVEAPFRPAGLEAHDTHAAASLLGQFRTSFAGWMWLRTDLYLHNGVEMRRLTAHEVRKGKVGVGSEADGHEELHDDSLIVTVVPSPQGDFRGIIGDLERETRAYKDMAGHAHNDPEDALPLFRLMTWVSPQFVNGWTTGALVMARRRDDAGTAQALDFLHEGLRHNPKSIDILTQVGYVLLTRRKDAQGALRYLDEARREGTRHFDVLSDAEVEALQQAYRWAALVYRDHKPFDQAIRLARAGLDLFPDDAVLGRLSHPPPLVLTADGIRNWSRRDEP